MNIFDLMKIFMASSDHLLVRSYRDMVRVIVLNNLSNNSKKMKRKLQENKNDSENSSFYFVKI